MKKTILAFILFLIIGYSVSYAQENPYAVQANVIKNEQSIENLRRQQANLYLKIEDLLVKYGELKGRLDEIARRLEAVEAKLNSGVYAHSTTNKPTQLAEKPISSKPTLEKTTNNHTPTQIAALPKLHKNIKPLQKTKKDLQQTQSTNKQTEIAKQNIKQQPPKQPEENKKTDEELYMAAKRLYDKKLYTDAIKLFNKIKDEYKDSKYVPNSIFYIAESYFNKHIYDKAIINYDYLINTYPNNQYVAKAVLKEGISFINLGDNIDGKYLLKKVISDYPQTKEAKDAQDYLARMK